ncbi:thiamine pyrophosphate-dependent dehydrogenase E1 component subunit alpha [Pseudokordiimonas caeni]|uniref:thiamine pyrophosphate-dependent dehydrogenase E1 component subunit alpha n=1 Tax=Pseudokordiimonas caeni TaxID=2997908 RepID=UPI0028126FD9|nr:thiamine pyrophosphate-dependent dehydrogenase E1 component subunit alpha [Pseudokordiimonas caeni]
MKCGEIDIRRAYHLLRTIRRSEEKIIEIYSLDVIKSPVHLSIGQEHLAVGACMALDDNDVLFSNYRGHAHYLARGGSLKAFWAELYGKSNGHARGKAGSMHLVDMEVNFMPASAIVASAIPNAVGYALACKMRNEERIVVCFHGDGAADEGVFWESLNFAALKKLPILFICENNGYAIYSTQRQRMAGGSISEKAERFGIPASFHECPGTQQVWKLVSEAADGIRNGNGPQLLEMTTYRWFDHVGTDDDHDLGFRDIALRTGARNRDDVVKLAALLSPADVMAIDERVEAELAAAIAYAETGEFPGSDELMGHDYV